MKPMSKQTHHLDTVHNHLRDIIDDAGISVELGVIFGSRVRDDATETSDTDVLLVSSDFVDVPGYRRAAPLLERWDHARYGAVDVLCYTSEEFCEFRDRDERTLPDRALSEGIVFYGESDEGDERREETPNTKETR